MYDAFQVVWVCLGVHILLAMQCAVYGNYFLFYIEIRTNRLIYFTELKPKAIDLFNFSHTIIFCAFHVSTSRTSNHVSPSSLLTGDIVPPTGSSTNQRLSLLAALVFKRRKAFGPAPSNYGTLFLPNDRNAHKTFPSSTPSSPLLLSFITQLSFVGLIRLYLVWVHWGEKHVKGKGRGSGSKVTWFVRLQKYLENHGGGFSVAFHFLHDSRSADVSLKIHRWGLVLNHEK